MIYLVLFVLLGVLTPKTQAALALCSSQNTGSNGNSHYNMYQSNGYCRDQCNGYAFAVVQGANCWCSNVQPGDTTSVGDCSENCPGYPSEKCGNEDKGLFGYVQLGTASSTDGGNDESSSTQQSSTQSSTRTSSSNTQQSTSSSTSPTRTSSSTTTSSSTEEETTSSSTTTSSSSSTPSSTTQSSTTSSSTTSTSSSTTASSTSTSSIVPQTSIIYSVKTITGSAQTQIATTQIVSTVTNTPSSIPSTNSQAPNTANTDADNNQDKKKDGFFDSTGKVAGTFTAVGVVVVALLSTLLYCCCLRKRHDDDEDEENGHHSGVIGLDDESAQSMKDEKFMDGSTTNGGGIHPQDFVEVDQRLDPRQMFMNWENGSRKSLADDMDYSRRVLRVTNE